MLKYIIWRKKNPTKYHFTITKYIFLLEISCSVLLNILPLRILSYSIFFICSVIIFICNLTGTQDAQILAGYLAKHYLWMFKGVSG